MLTLPHAFCLSDLVAKTNADGDERYFALYSSASTGRISFFYTPVDGDTRSLAFPTGSLADGQEHTLLLSVRNGEATLYIDGAAIGSTRALASAALADCGAPGPDCYLNVGQRRSASGGTLRLSGAISACVVYPFIALAP